jgi:hypothetical protein
MFGPFCIFKSIKRLMTGDKIRTIDVMIHEGMTKISLTLKYGKAGDLYVVLSNVSTGNNQYSVFEPREFDQFVIAAEAIKAELDGRQLSKATPT